MTDKEKGEKSFPRDTGDLISGGKSSDLVSGGNLVGTGCGYLVDAQAFLFLLKKKG